LILSFLRAILELEAVPKLQFWNSNLRFNRKSGPDFSPIRPVFPRACSKTRKEYANFVCDGTAFIVQTRIVTTPAGVFLGKGMADILIC
jgi:hypothetical protein